MPAAIKSATSRAKPWPLKYANPTFHLLFFVVDAEVGVGADVDVEVDVNMDVDVIDGINVDDR